MRIFKSKWFNKWAEKECIMDKALIKAITEMEAGLNDGDLVVMFIRNEQQF